MLADDTLRSITFFGHGELLRCFTLGVFDFFGVDVDLARLLDLLKLIFSFFNAFSQILSSRLLRWARTASERSLAHDRSMFVLTNANNLMDKLFFTA